jgi:hypothetical protein
MSVFRRKSGYRVWSPRNIEDGEMERWVLATLFASGSEPRDVYINVLFVTKMERVRDHTEVEFSSGTKISVMELPHRLIGHKPDRPI